MEFGVNQLSIRHGSPFQWPEGPSSHELSLPGPKSAWARPDYSAVPDNVGIGLRAVLGDHLPLLVFGGMPSALRNSADRTLPATLLLITGGGIFGLLAFGNWEKFGRQISRRRWILLCILSSLGFVVLIFAPTSYGCSGA
jgi:hypothetical protein